MDTNLDFKKRAPDAHNLASAQALTDNENEEVDKRKFIGSVLAFIKYSS